MKDFYKMQNNARKLLHGADYNPEQWNLDPKILDEDFRLMHQAGFTSVSIGIFSWTKYEPREGCFEFEWMDRLMDRLAKENITAFLATPSASKPMWMSEKYPEVRKVNREGLRERSGGRHNHCPSSLVYRQKVTQINTQLAKRFGNHPALGLWHVGNELGNHLAGECFCSHCLARFRQWLQERYQTLDALTEAWWGHFWNHTITDWEQIDPRDMTIDGMQVDWRRFVSHLHTEFLEIEIAPLKEHSPDILCTNNFMGFCPDFNYHQWSKTLDVISNDSYPNYDGTARTTRTAANTSLEHDLIRALAHNRPWLLMECSPSMVNWMRVNKLKPPHVHRMEVAQAVAHGADGVQYFQWRKGRGGKEKYHGAVVDHDARPDTRVFREVVEVGNMLDDWKGVLGSTTPDSPVAIVYDWESGWALNSSFGIKHPPAPQIGFTDASKELLLDHHWGIWNAGAGCDLIFSDENFATELSKRAIVSAPILHMAEQPVADALLDYVTDGGTLVLTHRSIVVDQSNRVHRGGLPGLGLHEAAGARIEEINSLFEDESVGIRATKTFAEELSGTYQTYEAFGCLHLDDAEVVARYTTGWQSGQPAATRKTHGEGEIWLVAGNFDDNFYNAFYKMLVQRHQLAKVVDITLPMGVHATVRENGETRFIFIINYTPEEKSINIPEGVCDSRAIPLSGSHKLAPFDVCLLQHPV